MYLIKNYPAIILQKSAKLERILYLMHFNCVEVVLKSN